MNLIPIFTGVHSISVSRRGHSLHFGALGDLGPSRFVRAAVLLIVVLSLSVMANGQTPKSSPSKTNDSQKGFAVKDLDKPFTQLSFEKVRVMAVTPDIAPEKPVAKPAPTPAAPGQAQTPAYSAGAGESSFSFGMYLAPPSSSFGTLIRSMQDQVEQRGQSRDADARQTSVDKMLGFVGARPVHIGPVNVKLSLGTGSVRTDALDLYDDQLLEKPEFVKHEETTP
jgi:hypothetical protein